MRKFNSIKKSRKKSKDIDEKIEYLDKECQKTGLNEITMGTSGVYQGSTTNPNEKYEEFTAINFNGYPLAMSGDGKQGHQSTGGASIRASDGAAMAPPHPVTGEIRVASTKAGIDPMFKIAVPGEKPTPQHRMTGDILWFYNASYNGGQGRWQSLEYNSPAVHGNGVYPGNRAGWGYWGSNFMGFPLLRDDEKHSDLFAALNDSDGIQFNPSDIGTPTTTVFFQNDLGDPSHLPINIGEISPEAFEYFRRRVNGNNNVASGGVNYDLYNYLHKRYGIGAANWYENNPTKPHGSNPNIPTPEAPYVPLASNSNDSRYSNVVSDTDINTGLGAKPGDQLAFGGFGGKPTPPTKKSDFKGIKRNAATTAATMSVNGMGMSPAAFEKKYGISPQDFLNLPENKTSDKKYLEETSKSRHFKRKVKNEDVIHNTKFNVIKKSRKKSKGIDEKIEYLNKECKKNNLQEIMSTSNMYVDGGTVPNQDYINFEGQSQGGYKLGLSAADGNNLGNAIIQNGEAFSPPHPVTGVRRRATHRRDGLGSTTALRPGVTIRRGFSDNAPPYTMGGALWFYDPNYNNGEGQWYNLEWGNFTNTTGWGFWDTIKTGQFAGIYKFETDLSKHPAANIASKIAGINFGNNGNIGTPQTIVLTKNDLGDPNSLPININVSPQAFDYLKNKAGQVLGINPDDNLATKIEKTKDAFINFIGNGNPIAKLLTSIPVFDYASEILTSLILNEPIYKGNNDVSMEDKQNYIKGIAPGYFLDGSNSIPKSNYEKPYSDDNIYKDPKTNQVVAHTKESKKQFPDNTSTFSGTNLGVLPIKSADGTSFGNTVNLDPFMITNKISARGNMQTQIVEPEDGSEVYLKVHDFAYLNEDKINDSGELPSWLQQGVAKPLINLINKFHGRKSGAENTGAMTGFSSNIHGVSELEFKIPFSQWTREQQEAYNKSKNK